MDIIDELSKTRKRQIVSIIIFIVIINIIPYLVINSNYATPEAKNIGVFTIPILSSIGLGFGLLFGHLLYKKI